jgi:adenylate kinase
LATESIASPESATEWTSAARNTPAIILFGSPGSGKGTQAKLLESALGIPHVSTGDMLRNHIEADDEIGREIRQLMKSGRLVPDDLVNRLVDIRLSAPDCALGVILDGYPRTLNQAGVLLSLLENRKFRPTVIHLVVDYERIVARLSGRRQCPVCGTLYNLTTHPPKVAGICDLDGATLVTREDDRESVIRERLNQYDLQTRPLLAFFRQSGVPVFNIEGAGATPEQVVQKVFDSLSSVQLMPAAEFVVAEPIPGQ